MNIEQRYNLGEPVPARDFNNEEGWELYGNVVHYLWKEDQSTQQKDMWDEVWHQRVHPIVPDYPVIIKQDQNGTTKQYGKRTD